ncbi:hypothetical protein B9G53_24740 [Pseudanabaena sp. SR411]|uniref:hypothetical protein n=1 Tax=Pseudanabaena sp. SR411 TaxID=1980935 RepID=UPI000B9999C7|nr:hypothetical protein [Pseudanabaena sp. SR411]OYQ61937.1 hypothetical protein B9G53_24740 [Pseudanabaena sp. SR411]
MSWIQVFSNGFVCEMDGDTAISSVDTKREVKKLIDALQDSKAGLYAIADRYFVTCIGKMQNCLMVAHPILACESIFCCCA